MWPDHYAWETAHNGAELRVHLCYSEMASVKQQTRLIDTVKAVVRMVLFRAYMCVYGSRSTFLVLAYHQGSHV